MSTDPKKARCITYGDELTKMPMNVAFAAPITAQIVSHFHEAIAMGFEALIEKAKSESKP